MTNGEPDRLDILIEQVGRLTEGLTEIKLLVREQSETAKQQAKNISVLSQAVERQSAIIDRILPRE
ncbi:MAG: hypothetical protein ACFE0J_22290 [Elainellaceae cyanobacterium]